MKFIVSSNDLFKSLQLAGSVINTNNTLAILDNFLFELNKGALHITASDLETTIKTLINVDTEDVKSFTVPSKILLETLKTFPDQPLTFILKEDNHTLEIISEQGKYQLAYEEAEEFPSYPKVEDALSFTLTTNALEEAINKTVFATGNDELRPIMTGVFFQISPEKSHFVATDAHRLVKYSRTDISTNESVEFIVPKKPLNILKNILSHFNEELSVTYNTTNAEFSLSNVWISCRLIDGKYPNYNAVIPQENPNVLTINRSMFLSSLRRVAIFANKSTHQVRLKLEGNTLTLAAENPDFSNKAEERLTCDYNGKDMEIGFNSKFLSEMLQNLETEDILLEMSEPTRAGIIKPIDGLVEGEEVLMLVMPILLNA